MLKFLVFKRVLNKLLLETEWSEFMLIWKFRNFAIFLKFFSIISLFKRFSLQFQLTGKIVPLPSTDTMFLRFFIQKSIIFFFSSVHFINKILKPKCKTPFSKLHKNWKRETLPKWFFVYKQLERCQNEYYPDILNLISFCRRTFLQVPIFPIYMLTRNFFSKIHRDGIKKIFRNI